MQLNMNIVFWEPLPVLVCENKISDSELGDGAT